MTKKHDYIHNRFKNEDDEKRKLIFNQKWISYISENIENENSIFRVSRDERGR